MTPVDNRRDGKIQPLCPLCTLHLMHGLGNVGGHTPSDHWIIEGIVLVIYGSSLEACLKQASVALLIIPSWCFTFAPYRVANHQLGAGKPWFGTPPSASGLLESGGEGRMAAWCSSPLGNYPQTGKKTEIKHDMPTSPRSVFVQKPLPDHVGMLC